MKKFFILSALAVCSLGIVNAKSYEIIFTTATKAGTVQLKPGQYKLKVDGNNATFTEVQSSKTYTTPAKVETGDKKFDSTRVQSSKDGDGERVTEIDLGGSKTKVSF